MYRVILRRLPLGFPLLLNEPVGLLFVLVSSRAILG